jgi:predicted naringenin-chalcone synthase
MGCHGAFNALQVGRAIARAEPTARVLVVAVELCSLHFAYGFEPQQIVANALFADGAGAAVLVGEDVTTDRPPVLRLRGTGSCLLPDSSDAMTWRIGDHGFAMTLSPRVPTIIGRHLRPWLTDWLGQHELQIDDIDRWAIHPGGPRVLESVTDALALDAGVADVSRAVLAAHGNMSSATILFILRELAAANTQTHGESHADDPRPIVALGFGPGLVAEAMLLV